MIHEDLAALAIPIDSVHPHPRNPRVGALPVIKQSLNANGQYRPIVVRRGTNEILAGNHTWKAAKELGWTEIAATWVTCSDADAVRIMVADNRTAELATDNEALLAELLTGLPSLEGTGYSEYALEQMIARLDPGTGESADQLELWGVIAEVDTEAEQATLLERLSKEGYRVRALVA